MAQIRVFHSRAVPKPKKIEKREQNNQKEKLKLCYRRPMLAICPLTRGLHNLWEWAFCDGADRQRDRQKATLLLNRPSF